MLRVKNKDTKTTFFIPNFEHISHLLSVVLLLTLNRQIPIKDFHVLENFRYLNIPYVLCQKLLPPVSEYQFSIDVFLRLFENVL